MQGRVFSRPPTLSCMIAAQRSASYASRQPPAQAELTRNQIFIDILDIEPREWGNLPQQLMGKVNSTLVSKQLVEHVQQYEDLGPGEWRVVLRDQDWLGRILVQCDTSQQVLEIYQKMLGKSICMGGIRRTLDITSPANPFLHSGRLGLAQPESQPSGE